LKAQFLNCYPVQMLIDQ